MMTVRVRLAAVMARWWLRERKQPPTTGSRLALRCWWTDCDINRHMNNSRYLALMDVGRWHYLFTTGLLAHTLKAKWYPVGVRIEIDYKKSIEPGDRFVLETVPGPVGTKSATLIQRFWRGDELMAEAHVVVVFLHKGKSQPMAALMEKVPHLAAVVPEPAAV